MAKDDEQNKTPTIAELMQVLDRLVAERKADNVEREAERKADRAEREADRAEREAEREAERKADRAEREAERKADNEVARERQAAADKRQEAVDRQVQATSKEVQAMSEKVREIGKQVGDVGNQWGKIAEYLVAGDLGRILKKRFGISIDRSAEHLSGSYQGKAWEVDVFAANGEIALVGEVKLTLTMAAVDKFVQGNLRNFHLYAPEYSDKKIYGMLAFVKTSRSEEQQIVSYVHSFGVLLVRVIDDTFHLLTPSGQELKDYNAT